MQAIDRFLVPQDDLLIEELTVFQNLWYTARLCFANLTEKEIEGRVNTIPEGAPDKRHCYPGGISSRTCGHYTCNPYGCAESVSEPLSSRLTAKAPPFHTHPQPEMLHFLHTFPQIIPLISPDSLSINICRIHEYFSFIAFAIGTYENPRYFSTTI